jgi:alpha-2-macroglobulin
MRAAYADTAKAVRLGNSGASPAWYALSQAGFDRTTPGNDVRNGIEIRREFIADSGKSITDIKVGDEIGVVLSLRATGSEGVGDIAVVDLLPGGFEVVQQTHAAPAAGEDTSDAGPETINWGIATVSTMAIAHADVREDRVVLHTTASSTINTFAYRIKATNAGRFAVPPAYAESLYDRTVQARSTTVGNNPLVVTKP